MRWRPNKAFIPPPLLPPLRALRSFTSSLLTHPAERLSEFRRALEAAHKPHPSFFTTGADRAAPWSLHTAPGADPNSTYVHSELCSRRVAAGVVGVCVRAEVQRVGSARRRQRLVAVSGFPSLCTRHRAGAERRNPTCYCLPPASVCVCVSGRRRIHMAGTDRLDVCVAAVSWGRVPAAARGPSREPGRSHLTGAICQHPPKNLTINSG